MFISPPWLILDIATAALPDAADYLTPASQRKPPGNYSKPDTIGAWQQADFMADLAKAGLDLDLFRLTGLGLQDAETTVVSLTRTEDDERTALADLAKRLSGQRLVKIITYNGMKFDMPAIVRRARYLGVPFPELNLDTYRSPHVDLCMAISNFGKLPLKSLGWYAKRLHMGLEKPLSGEKEARVHDDWEGLSPLLEQSIRHDLTATYRLAQWWGVLPTVPS